MYTCMLTSATAELWVIQQKLLIALNIAVLWSNILHIMLVMLWEFRPFKQTKLWSEPHHLAFSSIVKCASFRPVGCSCPWSSFLALLRCTFGSVWCKLIWLFFFPFLFLITTEQRQIVPIHQNSKTGPEWLDGKGRESKALHEAKDFIHFQSGPNRGKRLRHW